MGEVILIHRHQRPRLAEAAVIIRSAHASAAERIDELTREPERIKDEAERSAGELVRSAEADAARKMAEVEHQAGETIRESQQQAEAQRKEAERAVVEQEAMLEKRRQQLEDEIESLARLREQTGASVHEVVDVLQTVASDIEGRLDSIPNSEQAEPERSSENGKSAFKLLGRRSGGE